MAGRPERADVLALGIAGFEILEELDEAIPGFGAGEPPTPRWALADRWADRVVLVVMPGVVVAVSFAGALPPVPDRSGAALRESAWQGLEDDTEFLVLLGFANEQAAGDDLRKLVEAQDSGPFEGQLPTAVSHVAIEHRHGVVLDEVPVDGYLAVARAVANPGYRHETGERMEETVSTFVQLPGYCGHLQGFNEAIEEEAWAFVFASRRSDVPIPENPEVSVRLYRRIA